jgi:hypothetical protein
MQSEVSYYVDSAVLTVQCKCPEFLGYIREPKRKLYRLHYSWVFLGFCFLYQPNQHSEGVVYEMRVIEE